MIEKLRYVWDHRAEIAAYFIAAATAYTVFVATPLARIIRRPPPAASWWKRALYDLFIDTPSWLAALERSGIFGGIFNFPGVPSRLPADNPTPAASKMMRIKMHGEETRTMKLRGIVLPLTIALALGAASCATALGRCEVGTFPAQLEGLLVRVVSALFMPGADWTAQLEQAGKDAAPGQISCLVQGVTGYLEGLTTRRGQADDRFIEAQRRGQAYLEAHPASASCEKLPSRRLSSVIDDASGHRFGGAGATASYAASPLDLGPSTKYAVVVFDEAVWLRNDVPRYVRFQRCGTEVFAFGAGGAVYVFGLRVL